MKNNSYFYFLLILLFLNACSQNSSSDSKTESQELSATSENSEPMAEEQRTDTARKFVRTANLRFKVKNVASATHTIEQTVKNMGGFVTHTELLNGDEEKTSTQISADSTLLTTKYVLSNTMTIRVPNTELDSFLHAISPLFVYLENRTIKAEDVSMQFLANKLALTRANKHGKKIASAIDRKSSNLGDIVYAEKSLSSGQEQTDEAKVSMRSLQDQMNFSTVDLVLYQNPTVHTELIYTPAEQKPYEPSFFLKIGDSLQGGWVIMQNIVLFFTQLWGVFLIAGIGFLIYKKLKGKVKI